jgi:stage II sporulation protein D
MHKRVSRSAAVGLALVAFGSIAAAAQASSLFLVRGGGWGNGVGMSQWGAEGYALHGWDYERILSHYYPHTQISLEKAEKPIRILLAEDRERVAIGSATPFLLVDSTGRRIHLHARHLVLSLRLRLAGTALRPPLSIQPGATPLTLDGAGYRGSLTIERIAGRLAVVNTLPLERYLRGVVPSEMPVHWQAQAYETQAVAARSYALARLKPKQRFDLYADNRDQVYGGIRAETPATNLAVGATAGKVVTYEGRVITAYYDSNSGGRTAAVEDVFAGYKPEPYLVSVRDPYDSLSPYHRWLVAVRDSDLTKRFHMTVEDVRVEHNASGVASSVVLRGPHGQRTLTPLDFAQALRLRSIRFKISVVSLDAPPARALAGQTVTLTGFLRDIGGVVLQKRLADGSWQRIRMIHARRDGRFQAVVKLAGATAYRLAVKGVPGPAVAVRR